MIHQKNKLEWLSNRINKNLKSLKNNIKSWNTNAFRIYDKDIPEIPYQIDKLNSDFWITEKGVHPEKIGIIHQKENYHLIKTCLENCFQCMEENLWWQTRLPQEFTKKDMQKEKEITVFEGGLKFSLILGPYRDYGLFLDHRLLRLSLPRLYPLKDSPLSILNLYSYTGSFSVHLAKAGHKTINVDMSNTYINWSKKNFLINQINLSGHHFIQSDITKWLPDHNPTERYDIIILDPPSFSHSKRMGENVLDIQRDHPKLIEECLRLLNNSSECALFFSTNLRTFKLNEEITNNKKINVENWTLKTIPSDFRDKKIHQTFKITKRGCME